MWQQITVEASPATFGGAFDRNRVQCYRPKDASPARYERQNLASFTADDLVHSLAPEVERCPFLEVVAMPVVDGSDTRLNVVQNL